MKKKVLSWKQWMAGLLSVAMLAAETPAVHAENLGESTNAIETEESCTIIKSETNEIVLGNNVFAATHDAWTAYAFISEDTGEYLFKIDELAELRILDSNYDDLEEGVILNGRGMLRVRLSADTTYYICISPENDIKQATITATLLSKHELGEMWVSLAPQPLVYEMGAIAPHMEEVEINLYYKDGIVESVRGDSERWEELITETKIFDDEQEYASVYDLGPGDYTVRFVFGEMLTFELPLHVEVSELEEGSYTAEIQKGGQIAYYTFMPRETGFYAIYSTSDSDTYCFFDDETDDDSGEGKNFMIRKELERYKRHTIAVKFYDNQEVGQIPFTLEQATPELQEVQIVDDPFVFLCREGTSYEPNGMTVALLYDGDYREEIIYGSEEWNEKVQNVKVFDENDEELESLIAPSTGKYTIEFEFENDVFLRIEFEVMTFVEMNPNDTLEVSEDESYYDVLIPEDGFYVIRMKKGDNWSFTLPEINSSICRDTYRNQLKKGSYLLKMCLDEGAEGAEPAEIQLIQTENEYVLTLGEYSIDVPYGYSNVDSTKYVFCPEEDGVYEITLSGSDGGWVHFVDDPYGEGGASELLDENEKAMYILKTRNGEGNQLLIDFSPFYGGYMGREHATYTIHISKRPDARDMKFETCAIDRTYSVMPGERKLIRFIGNGTNYLPVPNENIDVELYDSAYHFVTDLNYFLPQSGIWYLYLNNTSPDEIGMVQVTSCTTLSQGDSQVNLAANDAQCFVFEAPEDGDYMLSYRADSNIIRSLSDKRYDYYNNREENFFSRYRYYPHTEAYLAGEGLSKGEKVIFALDTFQKNASSVKFHMIPKSPVAAIEIVQGPEDCERILGQEEFVPAGLIVDLIFQDGTRERVEYDSALWDDYECGIQWCTTYGSSIKEEWSDGASRWQWPVSQYVCRVYSGGITADAIFSVVTWDDAHAILPGQEITVPYYGDRWEKLVITEAGWYTLKTTEPEYPAAVSILTTSDDEISPLRLSEYVYYLEAGTYQLRLEGHNDQRVSIEKIPGKISLDTDITAHSFAENYPSDRGYSFLLFTPTENGEYRFGAAGSHSYPKIYILDKNGVIAESDKEDEYNAFVFNCELKKGKEYLIAFQLNTVDGPDILTVIKRNLPVSVTVEQDIVIYEDADYYKNLMDLTYIAEFSDGTKKEMKIGDRTWNSFDFITVDYSDYGYYLGYPYPGNYFRKIFVYYEDTEYIIPFTILEKAPVLEKQPKDVIVEDGQIAEFEVEFENIFWCQWQYSDDGGETWTDCRVSSATDYVLSVKASLNYNGRKYRCVVENDVGSVSSEIVTLMVKPVMPKITAQPVDMTAEDGAAASFYVKATGADSYQWQYKPAGASDWAKAPGESALGTYRFAADRNLNNCLYRCVVTDENGGILISDEAKLTVTPRTFTAPVISSLNNTTNGVQVKWNAVEGAEKYRVFYKVSGGGWTPVSGDETAASKIVTGLTSGTTYSFLVRCLSADGKTYADTYDASKSKSHTYIAQPAVSTLTNKENGVEVKWNAVPGAAQYRVFYKADSGSWTGFDNTKETSLVVTGLKAGTSYSFTVRCLSADGKTYTSTYNTTGKTIVYQPVSTMLAKPEITALNSNAAGVQVTWGAVEGAAQYRIFYKTATGAWTTFGNVKGTSATVTGLTSGTTYTFLVRCLSADAKAYTSDYDASKSKSHTYIEQPAVSSVSNTANGVEVKWDAVDGAAQYRVFYKAAGGAWTGFGNTTANSLVVTGLTAGTSYSFTVRCLSADGKTYTSTYDTTGKSIVYQPASTMLAKPEITDLNSNSAGVKVTWGAVAGAAQYRVFYKTATGAWTAFGNVAGTSATVTGLTSGTTYTFLVRCLSADGKAYTSDYDASKSKSHTYIAQPAVSSVTNTAGGVEVKWNAVGGAAQYRVFCKAAGGSWIGYKNTTGTGITVTGLTKGTTYSFTVRCLSADGKTYTSTYDTVGKSITVN